MIPCTYCGTKVFVSYIALIYDVVRHGLYLLLDVQSSKESPQKSRTVLAVHRCCLFLNGKSEWDARSLDVQKKTVSLLQAGTRRQGSVNKERGYILAKTGVGKIVARKKILAMNHIRTVTWYLNQVSHGNMYVCAVMYCIASRTPKSLKRQKLSRPRGSGRYEREIYT